MRVSHGGTPAALVFRQPLPSVLGPVRALAAINLAAAIGLEATPCALGVGVAPGRCSRATLSRGSDPYLVSAQGWIAILPAAPLVIRVPAINRLGDWLRDARHPPLQ
jgi:ABC-type dipeptide/oligopeptide/nickel transport system permease subunit